MPIEESSDTIVPMPIWIFLQECKTTAKISISENKVGWNGHDVVDNNTYDELKMIIRNDKGQMHFGNDDDGQNRSNEFEKNDMKAKLILRIMMTDDEGKVIFGNEDNGWQKQNELDMTTVDNIMSQYTVLHIAL